MVKTIGGKVFKIVSFADLVADVIIDIPRLPVEPAVHQIVKKINLEPGGAGNFLIAGQRLGFSMASLAVVGSDIYGSEIVNMIREEGVNVDNILVQEKNGTSTVFVLSDEHKQHVFLGIYGTGHDIHLSQKWKNILAQADAVQFWGYSFLEKRISGALIDAVRFAHENNILISFDPGPLYGNADPEYREVLLKNANIILLTEEEIPSLINASPSFENASQILSHGPNLVCVKRGEKGCMIFTRNETALHNGFPVEVLDTNAAGDAFNAAFLYAFLNHWTLNQIAIFANAMGAAKVQKHGSGRQVPYLNEVLQILSRFGASIPDLI